MKYISCFLIISIFLIGNVLADDCSIMSKVASLLGSDMKKKYSGVSDCCNFDGITCDGSKHITEM